MIGGRLVVMTVRGPGGVVGLALADVLVDVALELPAEGVAAAAAGHHDVLQRYGFGGDRRTGGGLSRVVAVCRGGVGPVDVVPAVELPVPFPAVGVLPHPALDGHQERADRQDQAADVQESRVPGRHYGRHDQQEAHRHAREIKHLQNTVNELLLLLFIYSQGWTS